MTTMTYSETCPCCDAPLRQMAHDPSRIATHIDPTTGEECSASRNPISPPLREALAGRSGE